MAKDRVTIEDLQVAAGWLDVNEGELGERESCKRVRQMLLDEIERREEEAQIQKYARDTSTPIKIVREAWKRLKKQKEGANA